MTGFLLTIGVAAAITPVPVNAQEGSFATAYADRILARDWDYKMISSGRNFPALPLAQDHWGEALILLHAGISPDQLGSHFDWTPEELDRRLERLAEGGLIRNAGGRWVPTVAVIGAGDAVRYFPLPESLIGATVAAMEAVLPDVRRLYATAPGLARIPFDDASLFVLSDVLLDDGQINHVEERFLAADRPLRAGSRYYLSIREDVAWDSLESLGIYGNSLRSYGSVRVGAYGNRRADNPMNLLDLDAAELRATFGASLGQEASLEGPLAHLVATVADPSHEMPSGVQQGFERLGWLEGGRVTIPVLRSVDLEVIEQIALVFTDDLVALLEEYRPALTRAYLDSPYGEEITFEEYFIWWYHLYYSEVTDRLVEQGHIVMPDSGIASYVVSPESSGGG